jgi:hypothetical protein
MKSSISSRRYAKVSTRKFVMALAVVSLLGGAIATPAFADDDHRGHSDQRGHERNDRGHADRHDERHDDRRDYRHPYFYSQPVYVPPTVYVAPQESPGISLFLPLNFRR